MPAAQGLPRPGWLHPTTALPRWKSWTTCWHAASLSCLGSWILVQWDPQCVPLARMVKQSVGRSPNICLTALMLLLAARIQSHNLPRRSSSVRESKKVLNTHVPHRVDTEIFGWVGWLCFGRCCCCHNNFDRRSICEGPAFAPPSSILLGRVCLRSRIWCGDGNLRPHRFWLG